MQFDQQVFIITGASGQIGRYLCRYCLDHKATKVIAVDADAVGLQALRLAMPLLETFACDLTDRQAVELLIDQISKSCKPTVLINNAGFIHSEPLVNMLSREQPMHAFDSWDRTIRANLYTTFNISALLASLMVKNRTKGLILNISSIAAQGNIGQTAYSAAKAGVESMAKTWARELGGFKIRSVAIAPGFMNTSSTHDSLSDAVLDKWKKRIPSGALGELDQLASAIRFVVENEYINGKVIPLDGGLDL